MTSAIVLILSQCSWAREELPATSRHGPIFLPLPFLGEFMDIFLFRVLANTLRVPFCHSGDGAPAMYFWALFKSQEPSASALSAQRRMELGGRADAI